MNFVERAKRNLWMLPAIMGGILILTGFGKMEPFLHLPSNVLFLLKGIGGVIAIISIAMFAKSFQRGRRFSKSSNLDHLRNITWQQFEKLLADLFVHDGYRVDERGGSKADGGIDLIAQKGRRRVLIQCKHWKKNSVGAPVIREIYGVMIAEKFDQACIATCGRFTKEAWNFAKGKPIRLLDGNRISQAISNRN